MALMLAFNTVQAQGVAHIDSEQLLMAMPETKAMEDELKKVQQTYADEYNAQATALQAKLNVKQATSLRQSRNCMLLTNMFFPTFPNTYFKT